MRTIFVTLAICAPLCAQEYRRSSVSLGFFAAIPQETNIIAADTHPGVGISYGFRFLRYLQADAGYERVFRPAPDFGGAIRRNDSLNLLPFGGRLVLPVFTERVLFGTGVGAVWAKYRTDMMVSPVVQVPQSGWGYYFLVNGTLALGRGGHLRAGPTLRLYSIGLEPETGAFRVHTTNRWVNLGGEVVFSF